MLRLFVESGRSYGSPRIYKDLLEAGWAGSVNTVADSMRRQGLQGRKPKHSKGLTRQDKKAPKFPDLLRRDFTAAAPNVKWCGDMTEIPTGEGKLYLATVLDLFSRRLLACPTSEHPNAELAGDAIKIAAAVRGRPGEHRGRDLSYRPRLDLHRVEFHRAVQGQLGIRQSMGRVGSCFDNAAAESFFSTLEHEVFPGTTSAPRRRREPSCWLGATSSTTPDGRHSSAAMMSPIDYRTKPAQRRSMSRRPDEHVYVA